MNKELIIYHGSTEIIKNPEYGKGKTHNDFGKGFYCTEHIELAKEWGCNSNKNGFANEYTINIEDLKVLNINSPDYSILNWISVLVNNRLFQIKNPIAGRGKKYLTDYFLININAFDVIIGYRADDAYFDFADAFLNNAITIDQLSRAMRLGKLGEQFVIKSKRAFERIKFVNAHEAERDIYYPKKQKRNVDAEISYNNILNNEEDGLYLIDIIRGNITNEDKRIPRNIYK